MCLGNPTPFFERREKWIIVARAKKDEETPFPRTQKRKSQEISLEKKRRGFTRVTTGMWGIKRLLLSLKT